MSPREQARLYLDLVESLRAEFGNEHGGDRYAKPPPPKRKHRKGAKPEPPPKRWTEEQVRTEAARRADLSSATVAKRLVRIFREAPPNVQEDVNQGHLSIFGALTLLNSPEQLSSYVPHFEREESRLAQAVQQSQEKGPGVPAPPGIHPRAEAAIAKILSAIDAHEHKDDIRKGLLATLQPSTRSTKKQPQSSPANGLD